MRVFFALDLDEPVRARAAELIEREKATVDARWVRPDALHLTVVFFGDTPPAKVPELGAAARAVAARHPGFRLELAGAGTFGPDRLPRVLWLGVEGVLAPLQALQKELTVALGVVSEHAEYRPHLTLARSTVKHGDPLLDEVAKRQSNKRFGEWSVDHLTLYESAGGRYRVLEKLGLKRS